MRKAKHVSVSLLILALSSLASLSSASSVSAASKYSFNSLDAHGEATQSYIVRYPATGNPEARTAAARAIRSVGGTVTREFSLIAATAADLTPTSARVLRSAVGIEGVVEDAKVRPTEVVGFDPKDSGAPRSIVKTIGADKLWDRGLTGAGIDIAVIDTGVNPVRGLEGRVVDGPDISFDGPVLPAALKSRDLNGHGTHMAGIIAGRDPEATGNYSKTKFFVGVAPQARIINVKVGAESGAVDVTQVISALEWVVLNKNANGLNIKIVNLSYGSPSTLQYWEDPLAAAAEATWRAGIVVVAAAGNDGAVANAMSPASNPNIIAVGAVNKKQGATTFTNSGGTRNPDLWAPGTSVVSLSASPTSNVERTGKPVHQGSRLIRGTGTSQAAAVISGASALLLQAYPNATPDQIRIAMIRSNSKDPSKIGEIGGVGEIGSFVNLDRAINLVPVTTEADSIVRDFVQKFNAPGGRRGYGSLAKTRGVNQVQATTGQLLDQETDWMGNSWSGNSWSGNSWSGNSWSGNSWSGNSWSGNSWSGNSWSGTSWSRNSWTGNVWAHYGWQ
jgi:serine protease AprX